MTADPEERGDARVTTRPGLRDVARLAGVSHQTVSRVFQGHPRVTAETRAKVLAAAAQLDFRPNAFARALATGRSRTLGVVSFDATLFGPASMISEIERCAREADYFTSVIALQSASQRSISAAAERLRGQGVDGLIVIPGHVPLTQTTQHLPADLPVVVMESETVVPSVGVDQYTGPKAATRYLLDLGHRTVHHLPGPMSWLEARERARGWRDALTEAGAPVPPTIPGDWSAGSGYDRGLVLAADPDITAIFAANDQNALGVLRALHEAGRRVPDDVSVIGFDNIPEAAYFIPPLTTIRQDFAAVGRSSVSLLLEQIESGRRSDKKIIISTELVSRSSAGRPPAR
ncbi:LacI family DNA-binding transcriptional regulator [Actinoallomurus rhizosphaericola]|uniref:LacI family DNA-binding transcriptional regulator n=1 Tax=Actinoallomurus rhizosphaericola TaxID=2952536 RepID=UPI002093B970|nr:LacI family DNA-binding transcriptional regulator [Actinoallomurus rhizosphaericola]MCO5996325.1 LacI family DNA-binding transcriptional regulator [Actinoallomurus rhizosphaericola]